MKKTLLTLTLVLALVLGTAGVASAITNGEPDAGRHPYVGLLVFDAAPGVPGWRCSGALLTATLVLTAGHCTDGAVAARIWMDENVSNNQEYPFSGATSYDGTAHTTPVSALVVAMACPALPWVMLVSSY